MKALSLTLVDAYVPLAVALRVSKVARSHRGFIPAYRKARGKLEDMLESWRRKREAFIARHEAQRKARSEPLWVHGQPTRRHLALIMWAYSPSSEKTLWARVPRM